MTYASDHLHSFEVVAEEFFEEFKRPSLDVLEIRLDEDGFTEEEIHEVLSYAREITTFESTGYLAIRSALGLQYDMTVLQVSLRTPEELARVFVHREDTALGTQDIEVETYDDNGTLAHYRYDRSTGLVLVNAFGFRSEEVRQLQESELDDLRFSINQPLVSERTRVLTEVGIARLTKDIELGLNSN